MTYKQGLMSGLVITLIITILTPLTQYLTSTVITPDYFQKVITYSVETGQMTQEEAESYFNMKNYIVQGLIGAPVMGLLTTAIVAVFTQKKGSKLDK